MKWILADLKEETKISLTFDYKEKSKEIQDILDISDTRVSGTLKKLSDSKVRVLLNVDTSLTLACARSLKEVTYPMNFDIDLILGSETDSDYPLENEIDLFDIVFGNIVAEKPYTIFHPSTSEEDFKEENERFNPFSDLDKNK